MTVIRSRWLFLFFRRKMETAELIRLAEKRDISRYENLALYFDTVRLEKDFAAARPHYERIYETASRQKVHFALSDQSLSIKFYELAKKAALSLAPHLFHYYLLYVEWDREPQKKFYVPRMHVLKPVVDDLQDLADGVIDLLAVSMPPRVGKLVSDDTPVLTKSGWKNHGDLTVGDYVVSPNGEFVRVNHVFPKNFADIRVHFSDGTFADVHENHEWVVYNRHKQKYCIMETKSMLRDFQTGNPGKRGHRYFYLLPPKYPEIGEYKKLPVEPYTLGAWLGDGRNTNPDICGDKADYPIVERIIADGYPVSWHTTHKTTGVEYFGFSGLRKPLQQLGMCHSRHRVEKHIPEEYLTASFEQRLWLLAGLLDTDGCLVTKEHRYHFTTAEPALRDSFISLVSTFGWRCSVMEQKPKLSSSGIQGRHTYWVVAFSPTFFIPCQLARKQLREFSPQRRIAITGFERIEPKPGNCISVDGGVYCIGDRLVPTHNSTLGIFYMTWLMGRDPDKANVMSGHSDKLTKGFFKEALGILSEEDYLWHDVFPQDKVVAVSSEDESISINHKRRFPTLTCRSVTGTLTGAVEVGNLLYVDDIIEDLEEALNPQRLQNKFDAYLNQLKDRKKNYARELHIGTRWAVGDVIGRLQQLYENNPKARFTVIPALDENGESNFDYPYGLGFSTAYYQDMKSSIDPCTWSCKYMGDPYVREGLLFERDELQYYNGVLPDGECDIMSAVDVAWGGGDSLSAPVIYWYGDTGYVHDWVFSAGDKHATQPLLCSAYIRNNVARARFEANVGGTEYAEEVDKSLRAAGYKMSIQSQRASTKSSKMDKIIRWASDIKSKLVFRSDKDRGEMYDKAMNELCRLSIDAKKQHDDAADSLAMSMDYRFNGLSTVQILERRW